MITQILVQQTIIMFFLMIIGWILAKFSLLTEHGSREIGNILLYLVIPCVIIRSYMTECTAEKVQGLGLSAFLAIVAFGVSIAISYLTFGLRRRLDNFGTAFCNAGFIGIPLVSAVFGNEAAFYIAAFATMLNFLQWTYGIMVITGDKQYINLKKIFLNPVCIAVVIGVLLFFSGIQLPPILSNTMDSIAGLNTPAAMIILGFYLSKVQIKEMFTNWHSYFSCFLRLIVIPIITMLVLRIIPFGHGTIGLITLIAASTPIGTSTAIFAQRFDQDYKEAVILVCLSTILSIVTIPIVIAVAQMLY